jgi:hypothetical protein
MYARQRRGINLRREDSFLVLTEYTMGDRIIELQDVAPQNSVSESLS